MSVWEHLQGLSQEVLQMAETQLGVESERALIKAETEGPEAAPGGSQADTAASNPVPTQKAISDPKALFWDPYSIIEQLGYRDRPSPITYYTLRHMVQRAPAVQAIIMTRSRQVASFSKPTKDRYQMGCRIKVRDSEKEPTKAELQWIKQMESVITRTGVTSNPRGRDNFTTFLKKIMWDTMTFDQMCFEIVENRKGEPAEWYAVDASTIRLADSASTYFDEDELSEVRYVQIYDSMIINEYTQNELCFGVRNPRTDIKLYGYGVSELEMLINVITALLSSWEYNQKFFSQGSASKGIINFKGPVNNKQLQAFRRMWYQQISSVQNAWRTPITNSPDLQYIDLQQSSKDMEFNAWMDFQLKLACAMYGMDPSEINFKYGNVGQKSGLQESSNREKVTESKERGLRPLLDFIADCINQYIVYPINENFEFAFCGLDAMTRDDVASLNMKRGKVFMTVDELRAEEDKPPLPDGKGEVILDPTWLQYAQMKEGMAQGDVTNAGSQMGEGEAEDTGNSNGEESDFETMLARMEQEDEEESDQEDVKSKKAVQKSLSRQWIIEV